MAFRYLIYRTDYGNTIVRESAVNDATGNEAALFTDFVIPVNQPFYLWRVVSGDVVPNIESNINNWLNFVNPPTPESPIDYQTFTAYTASTSTVLQGIQNDLADKLDSADFNIYTGVTETRLQGIESNITFVSGQTANKLNTSVFNAYTGATRANEIYLVRTGATGININTITPTAIVWNGQVKSSTLLSWTGGSSIFVNTTGDYEITYNVPFTHSGSNNSRSIGANLVINNTTIINRTITADNTNVSGAIGALTLPSVVVSLTSGTKIDLVAYRAGNSGTCDTAPTASILIKKKNTLQ